MSTEVNNTGELVATVPMQSRPENVTVKGWLQEQIEETTAKLDAESAELQRLGQIVTMRDGEYEDAKKAADTYKREKGESDHNLDVEEGASYDRLSEANRAYGRQKVTVRKLQNQLDFMQEKIKWMPPGF